MRVRASALHPIIQLMNVEKARGEECGIGCDFSGVVEYTTHSTTEINASDEVFGMTWLRSATSGAL